MGLVYTALCFSLFTDGLRYVRVEHAGILGYLEPVTAPLWALLLVGEQPPLDDVARRRPHHRRRHLRHRPGPGREPRCRREPSPARLRRDARAAWPHQRLDRRDRHLRRPCRRPCWSRCAWCSPAVVLGVVVAGRGATGGPAHRRARPRCACSAAASPWRSTWCCYFVAIRQTGVAVAIFLWYLAPLYVAFVAPRPRRRTHRGAPCTPPSASVSPAWR